MTEYAYIVYYIKKDEYWYCMNSGNLDFTININNARQYTLQEAVNIANYFGRTNKCKGCEIGFLKIIRTVVEKTITKVGDFNDKS